MQYAIDRRHSSSCGHARGSFSGSRTRNRRLRAGRRGHGVHQRGASLGTGGDGLAVKVGIVTARACKGKSRSGGKIKINIGVLLIGLDAVVSLLRKQSSHSFASFSFFGLGSIEV